MLSERRWYNFASYREGANDDTKNRISQDARTIARVWQWKVSHATIKSVMLSITRTATLSIFFDVLLQASDDRNLFTLYREGASVRPMVRERAVKKVNHRKDARDIYKGIIARPTTQQSNIICCRAQEATTMSISLLLCCKRRDNNYFFDVARSGRIAREQATWRHHCKTRGRNNQILYVLSVARMTATSTVDCKDGGNVHTFLCCTERNNHEWWIITTKECEIAPSNNQPNLYVASRERATITERQHCWRNDDALRCVARGYYNGNNGWLQRARNIAQATANPFHQCGSTTSTFTKAQSASNKIDCDSTMRASMTRQ